MTSVKCPQCGFVYWSTAENCKRCGLATKGGPADESRNQEQSYAVVAPPKPYQSGGADEELWLSNLRLDARRFYLIGGLQALLWFVVGNLLIVDAVLNFGLSFVAHKFKSRIASVALLLLTLLSVMFGLMALVMGTMNFNPFVPLVLLGRLACSIRMVYTTFKLNARVPVDVTHMMPPLPPVFHHEEPQWAQPVGGAQWQPE